ncbi:MAG: VTT domain-containing protein, partial [Oscillospiraceae bacterium]
VNMLGLLLCISIPYVIGRFSGTHLIDFLIKKFKKVQKINDLQSANTLFTSYLLRVVSILPGDIVSLYFGASKAKFFPYCVGSLLGLSPIMIIQTLMGENLDDLFSLKFFLLFLLMIVISFASSRIFNQKIKESEKK